MMDIDLPRRWLEVHGPLNKVSSANVILDEDAETLAVWGSASFDDDSIVVYLTYRVGAMMMLCGPKKGVEEQVIGGWSDHPIIRATWTELVRAWVDDLRDELA